MTLEVSNLVLIETAYVKTRVKYINNSEIMQFLTYHELKVGDSFEAEIKHFQGNNCDFEIRNMNNISVNNKKYAKYSIVIKKVGEESIQSTEHLDDKLEALPYTLIDDGIFLDEVKDFAYEMYADSEYESFYTRDSKV